MEPSRAAVTHLLGELSLENDLRIPFLSHRRKPAPFRERTLFPFTKTGFSQVDRWF